MKRRSALAAMFGAALAGCGGGGGGTDAPAQAVASNPAPAPSPAPAPAAAPAPAVILSDNVALWGDSLTFAAAPHLATLLPSRTVYNGGVNGQTSQQILQRVLADTAMTSWISVFWYGRNNVWQPAQIVQDVSASVAHLTPGNDRFLVLPILNDSSVDERRGGSGYNLIMQANNALAARYAGNYLDLRSFLVGQADPTQPQDVIDQQNDVVPSSLRVDAVHLTVRGNELVAAEIKRFMDAKGW